jgi:hypothetical protein
MIALFMVFAPCWGQALDDLDLAKLGTRFPNYGTTRRCNIGDGPPARGAWCGRGDAPQ